MVQVNCPSCGSPVQFRAAHTLYSVCTACGTLLVRQDVEVKSLGKVADLQPDGTALRVGTLGNHGGKAFEVLGRLQIRTGDGYWNEYYIIFSNGREGWIGEAMGEYFLNFAIDPQGSLPRYDQLQLGDHLQVGATTLAVTSKSSARAVSFEGELPFIMKTGYDLNFADLRSAAGEAATLDYSEPAQPLLFVGEYVEFEQLNLVGLREDDEGGPSLSSSQVRSLKCPSCGAAHELKSGPLSKVLVCQYCDTAIDTTNPQFAKLYQANQEMVKVPALIPLGTKGRFSESPCEWECLGFLRRAVTVDAVDYYWTEYLLYERYHGYRWLTEANGHWSLIQTQHGLPADGAGLPVALPPPFGVIWKGVLFKHFQTARSRVSRVAGEFYWQVKAGDTADATDYVAPPYLISAEVSPDEVVWSLGVYKSPAEVWQAFALKGEPPTPQGVAPNQPNPHQNGSGKLWAAYWSYVGLAFIMMIVCLVGSGIAVKQFHFPYFQNEAERSHVTEEFQLEGRTSNLQFEIDTDLKGRWAYFQLSLINLETNEALDTGQTVSYYFDADGTYGSQSGTVLLPSVPPGRYVLRVEPTSGTGDSPDPPSHGDVKAPSALIFSYDIKIYRDVPEWSFFWMFAGLLIIPPLWVTSRNSSFETRRWMESDHAPVSGGDNDS